MLETYDRRDLRKILPGRSLAWPNGDFRAQGDRVIRGKRIPGVAVHKDDPYLRGFEHQVQPLQPDEPFTEEDLDRAQPAYANQVRRAIGRSAPATPGAGSSTNRPAKAAQTERKG